MASKWVDVDNQPATEAEEVEMDKAIRSFMDCEVIDFARSQEIPVGARIRFRADGMAATEGILTRRTRNGFYTILLDSGESVTYRNLNTANASFMTLGSVWRYDQNGRFRSGNVTQWGQVIVHDDEMAEFQALLAAMGKE